MGPGPGRPKGSPNKVHADLRDMIIGALNGVGGMSYLEEKAVDPKTAAAFLTLVGKCLPKEVKLDANVTLTDLLRQAEERRAKMAKVAK